MIFKLKKGYGKHIVSKGKGKVKIYYPGDKIEVKNKKALGGARDKFERIDYASSADVEVKVNKASAKRRKEKKEEKEPLTPSFTKKGGNE